jgi:chromate reductase, NAD(P)H dehydrogenase (quinone)
MKKKILAIIGSASKNSSNLGLTRWMEELTKEDFEWTIFDELATLPHFNPELSVSHPPAEIINFRELVLNAEGVIICTPEYVFSIPAGLKNAIEWCVSTTLFSQKPVGLITASAHGEKAHEELQLIMKTIEAKFTAQTTLLIHGIKAQMDEQGNIKDATTVNNLKRFIASFNQLVTSDSPGAAGELPAAPKENLPGLTG